MAMARLASDLRTLVGAHAGSFGRFVVVGALGFLSDYAMLLYLVRVMGVDPFLARIVSVAIAILLTWALNKSWSFRERGAARRSGTLAPYYGIQVLGALINYGAYGLVLMLAPATEQHLLIPMAVGSGIALFFNYFFGRRLFKGGNLLARA